MARTRSRRDRRGDRGRRQSRADASDDVQDRRADQRNGRTFANAPATATYLVAGAPGDFRDYIRVVNGGFLYEGLRHLR